MIIGICGFQSSGKDTIAEFLIKEYGFQKLSFACALKDIVSVIFGWSREKLEGLTKEDRKWREEIDPVWSRLLKIPQLSPRFVLQYFGTELFRKHWHPDIWVKVVERQLIDLQDKNIVITDCRFENEINMILRYGGKMFHVYRDLPYWFKSYKEGRINSNENIEIKSLHPSETSWIRTYVDYEIDNKGTKEELYSKIKNIIWKTT